MNVVFEIDHVSKVYKKGKVKANRDIHFDVLKGEVLGLLGPNGAGKSTLIQQMVAHLAPSEGEIRYEGVNVLKQPKRVAQNVAYYAQEPHTLTSLKVWEALCFTGMLRGIEKKEALRQADELLERFEMTDLRTKQLKHISGGQKRMVGIGTALIGRAPVLIFDEPTNELDPKKRRLVWDLIQERNQEGATVILVTHNVLEAEQVVDRVAVINHGRLFAIDHVSKLKQKVDQRLKFELVSEMGKSDELEHKLATWGEFVKTGENRLRLLIEKQEASRLLDFIVGNPQLPIEEYAVVPPSLEDVYFYIEKEKEHEHVGAASARG
ncbi:ABC transporter ATP-binding protein [Cohnella pontilimi]|uniref:ABC transporter ATP-binding protein n=1 Tax=Cohnella pontilimi TaxID=2564100 RepID=A0A4U0F5R4_9BACL|nr:ABC transporter ATP-binding protein [Cohnella pontilimi]TJY39598.1 ABC transporter ATP-binding protein [Cohnella pontilimi]